MSSKVVLVLFCLFLFSCQITATEVDVESTVDRVFAMKENDPTDDSGIETLDQMKKVVLEKSTTDNKKENTLENLLNEESKSESVKQQSHSKVESEGDEILEISSKVLSEPSDETKQSSTTLSAPTTSSTKNVQNEKLDSAACFDLCINTGNKKEFCSKSCKA
eukprot:gene4206-7543_t